MSRLTHGDILCDQYLTEVLPDEKGNCSLCGATLNAGFVPEYPVHCKYCAHVQKWSLESGTTIDDILKYDLTYLCQGCGCPVRVSEALEESSLKALGYSAQDLPQEEFHQWYALREQAANDGDLSNSDKSELIRLNHLVMEAAHEIHNANMLEK